MIDREEFEYWQNEFPELDRADIIDILEYYDDMKDEINTENDD